MSDKLLVMAAARLSSRAPPEWAEFLSALAVYVEGKRDELMMSNRDTLPVAQGRAQGCDALRKILVECRTTAEKIEKNINQKPHSPR